MQKLKEMEEQKRKLFRGRHSVNEKVRRNKTAKAD
jgi:hypothetical protein